jgi:SAM-dependent methyltransferase
MSFRFQAEETVRRIPDGAKRVLDLGCGTAALAPDLIAAGVAYTGVDRDPAMLLGARMRLRGSPARLVRADATGLPFAGGTFDAVTSLGLFEYLPDPVAVLREVRRVLGDGGVALLTVPRRESFYRRCQAFASPFLRIAGRDDPFDLHAGRRIEKETARSWAAEAGLRLREAAPVSPAVLPWPLDRVMPRVAGVLARRAGSAWGTVHLFAAEAPPRREP